MNAVRANLSDEMRQIKIGLLVWALIWIVNKAIVHMTLLALPSSSFAAVDLLLKTLNFIASIVLMVYVIRIWQWDLDDWGFTYDLGFWVALLVTCVYVGYFWYMEGLPTDFGTQTIRQALTGIWEELISTVFFTLLLTKYFRTLPRLSAVSAKTLAVVISAIVFTLIHYGQWTMGEVLVNTSSFIIYRVVYAFVGTFFFGLVIHGVSNSHYMAFPLLLAFYGVVAILNWRTRNTKRDPFAG